MPSQDDDHPVSWLRIRFGWDIAEIRRGVVVPKA